MDLTFSTVDLPYRGRSLGDQDQEHADTNLMLMASAAHGLDYSSAPS